jgi:hypothetical protein
MTSERIGNDADASAEPIEREAAPAGAAARLAAVDRSANRPVRSAGWNGAIGAMKEALGHLELVCSAIIAESAAAADEAARRVMDAKSETEAAAQRARLDAQMEITELRSTVDRLKIDLQMQRERFQNSTARLDTGDVADAANAGAKSQPSELVASYRSQVLALRCELEASWTECSQLARQLEVEKANRARLIAAVQAMQHARPPEPARSGGCAASALPAYLEIDDPASEHVEPAVEAAAVAPAEEAVQPAGTPAADMSATAASDAQTGIDAWCFDPAEYARQLLDDIEAVYAADVASGLMPGELVERLAGNLTYGADVFARRLGFVSMPAGSEFEEQLATTLVTKGATPFGRHLAVAAYECRQQRRDLDCERVA